MKKFLKENKFKNKKVTLLVTHAGGPGKVMKRFRKYIDKSNEIVHEDSIQLGMAYQEANIVHKKKN